MYDALTPLFDKVTDADLKKDFKSEKFGLGEDGPGPRPEKVPRKGVTIVRDKFNVPHVTGKTHDDVTGRSAGSSRRTAGCCSRRARYPARFAALDAPDINAFGLVIGLKQFTPTKQVDQIIERNGDAALKAPGKKARRCCTTSTSTWRASTRG